MNMETLLNKHEPNKKNIKKKDTVLYDPQLFLRNHLFQILSHIKNLNLFFENIFQCLALDIVHS